MPINWMDIIIIVFLLYSAIDGMGRGFLLSILNIAGLLLALYFSNFFCSYAVTYILKNTHILPRLEGLFVERINNISPITTYLFNNSGNGQRLQTTISLFFIKAACFLCLFIIITFIINIFKDMIKGTVRRTPIKYADRLLGFIFGFIKGVVIVFLFFALMTPVMTLLSRDNQFVILLNSSAFTKYFFTYNFIVPWIQKINASIF